MRFESLSNIIVVFIVIWSAAGWDAYQRRVPNVLVFVGVILGSTHQFLLTGPSGILAAFFGGGIGLIILLPSYLMSFTGAGDVKLMAAIGTFLGPYDVFIAAITSIAVGSVIALGYAASSLFNQTSISPWSRYGLMFKTLVTTGRPIYIAPAEGEVMGRKFPFAVSIAIGTTLFLVWDSQLLTLAGLAK
ncbi:prepilin peptidase CpaA [Modicisalibacter xianhensis]|uniref:Prepilin peptidase CpaA n=1 Tax=Modicisalibacter xianhensis TaxID=442341 RepID=A0A4R8FPM9_9GAMM|nr:A24 family peptidase [Halomonas xianhensis]TDX28402.1 prepilin peptidase CpaA [Halomonas xianhensis]